MYNQNHATTVAQSEPDITMLWHQKITELSNKVMRLARGNPDDYQNGILGIHDALTKDPYATNSFILQGAKFAIRNARSRGCSIDNGYTYPTTKTLSDGTVRTYKKEMRPVFIDHLMGDFNMEYPESSYPPDTLAIDKLCAWKFYGLLNRDESQFVDASIHCLGGRHPDYNARKEMGIERPKYDRLRRSTRRKFIRGFGTDEDLDRLEQFESMGEDMYR